MRRQRKKGDYPFETTRIGRTLYNVEILKAHATHLPSISVKIVKLKDAIAKGNYYWIDRTGKKFGPHQLLQNWEAAKKKMQWRDHVENIEKANVQTPIFLTPEYLVFDGMHRLTRAFLEEHTHIKAKVFTALPESAIVEKGN